MIKTRASQILKKIHQRSLSDILRIMMVYAQYYVRNRFNRKHSRKNKDRDEKEWAKLLGLKSTGNYATQMAERFYSDQVATFPDGFMIKGKSQYSTELDFFVNKTVKHHFDILGSGWLKVEYPAYDRLEDESKSKMNNVASHGISQKDLMHAAIAKIDSKSTLIEALVSYEPIDWQLDFKSGYRWLNTSWYLDIEPGNVDGVDIKVPWELSRFYHAGPMGAYWIQTKRKKIAEEFQLQIIDWIVANPLYHGVNWRNAMEAGIRVANWLLGISFFKENRGLTSEFLLILQKSLYEHASFIMRNLEKTALGSNNHYLGNLVGLITIGASSPWIPESDRWLLFGVNELIREMHRQVYRDGTHFEASTSYHRLVTEIFLCCYRTVISIPESRKKRLSKAHHSWKPRLNCLSFKPARGVSFHSSETFPVWFTEKLCRMVEYVKALSKPDENLPQIGDNDSGRLFWLPLPFKLEHSKTIWMLNAHQDLITVAEQVLDVPSGDENKKHGKVHKPVIKKCRQCNENERLYPYSGIAIYRKPPLYLVICCGTNGGHLESSHAHNDKLSFELSLYGVDFIVDSGTYLYTSDPINRNNFRSTWAHNTIVFPGLEQNPINANDLFRLPDRSKAKITYFDKGRCLGKHVGFGFTCEREYIIEKNGIQIKDKTEKPGGYFVLNFHPKAVWMNDSLISDNITLGFDYNGISKINLRKSLYSPRYGVKVPNHQLVGKRTGRVSVLHCYWN